MPRFYFNIVDSEGWERDLEGVELPDIEAARHEAQESIRECLIDAIKSHEKVDGKKIEITDETGSVLETLEFCSLLD